MVNEVISEECLENAGRKKSLLEILDAPSSIPSSYGYGNPSKKSRYQMTGLVLSLENPGKLLTKAEQLINEVLAEVIPLHPPRGDTSTERAVHIDGTSDQIEAAKQMVEWLLDDNDIFSIKALMKLVEEKCIDVGNNIGETMWNKLVPKKVNIFMWRVGRDVRYNRNGVIRSKYKPLWQAEVWTTRYYIGRNRNCRVFGKKVATTNQKVETTKNLFQEMRLAFRIHKDQKIIVSRAVEKVA
ncbi:hypothetical protein Tco_0985375 [Tanacetum coccineum]